MKKAFTLIELLVVIAIIAILAAILFPVFAQAKMAAKKISALSNIKQINTGVQIYIGDFDDVYPMGSGACWWIPSDGGWAQDTKPYIKSLPILRDPVDPGTQNLNGGSWEQNRTDMPYISFASNGYMYQSAADGWKTHMHGVMGMLQGPDAQVTRCGNQDWMADDLTNATAVVKPATTIMLATRYGGQPTWGTGDFLAGVNWWDWTGHAGLVPDPTRDGTPYTIAQYGGGNQTINTNNRWGALGMKYGNVTNVTYCDGHAKSVSPSATNPDPVNHYELNQWDAYLQQ